MYSQLVSWAPSSYAISDQVIRDDAGPVTPQVVAPRRRLLDESATSIDSTLLALLFDASHSLVIEREVEVFGEVDVSYSALETSARRAASWEEEDNEPFVSTAWQATPLYDFREDAEGE